MPGRGEPGRGEDLSRGLEGFGERILVSARNMRMLELNSADHEMSLRLLLTELAALSGYLEQARIELSRVRETAQAIVSWETVRERQIGQLVTTLTGELRVLIERVRKELVAEGGDRYGPRHRSQVAPRA